MHHLPRILMLSKVGSTDAAGLAAVAPPLAAPEGTEVILTAAHPRAIHINMAVSTDAALVAVAYLLWSLASTEVGAQATVARRGIGVALRMALETSQP